MTNPEEDKLVAELDREFTGGDSLLALIACFGLSGWMMAATAFSVFSAG